ncbi:neither inactivation nor afterpotential B [Nesidiocoris tenuis]|uniref:Neither inactivation nor afterpotential B n=1 Tax=Nesidiocoris tenuis TaxID=355587 RepID=A0ABN7ALR1_9HEMI|nr:neither inactivation nor afterpotential B [Nesidiocoris tenuis]
MKSVSGSEKVKANVFISPATFKNSLPEIKLGLFQSAVMDIVNKLIFGDRSPNKFETVIKDEVAAENEKKKSEKLEKLKSGEKLYDEPFNLHMYMRDCLAEMPEPISGTLEGEIPSWLNGSLIRNGPGKRSFGEMKTQHAFDSAALLRRFAIKNGQVTFQCKFIKSRMYTLNTEAQRIVMGEFGTASAPDPCKTLFQRFASVFQEGETTDNCLVTVYPFNDELYALTETVIMQRIEPQSLETLKRVNLKDYVALVHHTAHPHVDEDGTVYCLGMTAGQGGAEYAIIEFPNTKLGSKCEDVFSEGKIVAKVPTRWRFSPCYMHSYGMTPNYFIIIEQPVGISLINRMVGKIVQSSFADCLKWYDEPTLIHVVSRKTGKSVGKYEAEPFAFFHTINQFEEDGHVIIDICCYKDFSGVNTLLDETLSGCQKDPNFADLFRGRPARFVCPLDPPRTEGNLVSLMESKAQAFWNGDRLQVTAEILHDKSCDMPRVNYEKYNGKKYRYFYCFSGDVDDDYPLALKKIDVTTKTRQMWSEPGVYPSEPIFVQRPGSEGEDDGVILSSLLYKNEEKKISLLVLDAKNMKELGRVNFSTSGSMPSGFHVSRRAGGASGVIRIIAPPMAKLKVTQPSSQPPNNHPPVSPDRASPETDLFYLTGLKILSQLKMDCLEKTLAKYSRNKSKLLKFSKSIRIPRIFFSRKFQNCCGARPNKYERIIGKEINAINYLKGLEAERRYNNGEDVLPHCDLTVWLRDCKQDIDQPIAGDSMGTIPPWLKGNLLRNGPGALSVGEDHFNHLFDAPAVLHRFRIDKGKATYQCKFLKSETYKKNMAAQRIVVDEFGTKATAEPCKTIFEKFSAVFSEEMSDNCMISIYPFGDQIFAMGETPVMYRIDPNNVDTVESMDIKKYVNIVHNSSHPHVEEDGTVYMLGLSVDMTGPKYSIVKFPNTNKGCPKIDVFSETQIVAKIGTRWPLHPGYMHSFGLTPNYYILVEQPLSVSLPAKIAATLRNRPLCESLKWYPDYPTIFYVVSRQNSKVVLKYEAEPFFYLHIINQYEEEGHVVVDVCAYKDPKMIDCMLVESLKGAHENPKYANLFRSRPVRFVLPLRTHRSSSNLVTLGGTEASAYYTSAGNVRVIPEILCNMGCETPRINYPARLGKKYRYFYSISADVDLEHPGTLLKVDTYTRTCRTWNEPGTFPCEPIFVPAPNAQSEDDGVVLTSLLWESDEKKVALVILDAKSFTEIARTEFYAPTPVPKCLHGWFSS